MSTARYRVGTATVAVETAVPEIADGLRFVYPAYRTAEPGLGAAEVIRAAAVGDGITVSRGAAGTRFSDWRAALTAIDLAVGTALLAGFPDLLHLHAGAVTGAAGALLLPASSGSGKSTLVAHCCRSGFPVFGDDVVLLHPTLLQIEPFRRLLKLEQNVWPLLGLRRGEAGVGFPWPDVALIDPPRWPGGWAEPAPLRAVVIPRFQPGAPSFLEPVHGGTAVIQLLSQSFNVAGGGGIAALARLVDSVAVYRLRFGDLASASAALAGLLGGDAAAAPPHR